MIVGLDLSLNATGVARLSGRGLGHGCYLETLTPPKNVIGEERLTWVCGEVAAGTGPDAIVVIEGLSMGKMMGGAFERAALHWMVRCELKARNIPFHVVPPTTLKLFVTGKGNAEKSMMLREVYRRWGVEAEDDNQADAAALAYLGACITGCLEPQTDAQRRAVASVLGEKPKKKAKKAAA